MKNNNPERIYVERYVGTNGIHCLDYKNYDDSIEYIRADLIEKLKMSLEGEERDEIGKEFLFNNLDIILIIWVKMSKEVFNNYDELKDKFIELLKKEGF